MTNSYTYEQDRLKTINVNGALQYQFAYDVFGRTTSTKVGNGTSFRTLSSMTYNNAGLLARQTYGNGDYIDFTYDSLDRITRKQYNGSSTNRMEYLYGSDGSVAQTIDYAANTHTKFVYDLAGRLVSQREYGGVTQLPSYPNAYTNFTYADKTNYLTGIKHVSPLGTQNIGYRYGDLSKQEMPDQIYGVSWNGEEKLSYTYDGLGRLTNKALKVKDDPENGTLNMGYVYEDVGEGERTTTLLKRLLFAGNPLLDYTYDAVGNITSICDGSLAQSFEYDDLNQLVRFNDRYQNKTFTYEYENGNITFEHEYAYTTGELPATPKRSTQYHYDDPAWSDVLTGYSTLRYTSDGKAVASINSVEEIKDRAQSDAYARRFLGDRFKKVDLSKNSLLRQNAKTASVATNGNVIVDDTVSLTVDEIGNLTKVGTNAQLKWNGRQLQDIVMEDGKISYAYNADGQRISKTLTQFGEESVTTEYFYNGEILAGQKTGNDVLVFMYDNNGDIFGFTYNGKPYYYIKNAQNDVMFIVDPEEGAVVLYTYDAWGNITACYDASENNIGTINPITYRSYYYDFELGMYYLNSRYYMPALHRFLNADGYAQTGQGMLDKNMFAYCLNNPVNFVDPIGTVPDSVLFEWARMYAAGGNVMACGWAHNTGADRTFNTPSGKQVLIYTDESRAKARAKKNEKNTIVAVDKRRTGGKNPNIQVCDSYKIHVDKVKYEVIDVLLEYDAASPNDPAWGRTRESLKIEWDIHNYAYMLGFGRTSSADVDFDYNDEGKNLGDFVWERVIERIF